MGKSTTKGKEPESAVEAAEPPTAEESSKRPRDEEDNNDNAAADNKGEPEGQAKKARVDEGGHTCFKVTNLALDMEISFPYMMMLDTPRNWRGPEIWRCGLVDPAADYQVKHEDHATDEYRAMEVTADKLTHQLSLWRPGHNTSGEWRGFFITKEVLDATGVAEGASVEDKVRAVLRIPGPEEESHNKGYKKLELQVKPKAHSLKTFWPQRFYFQYGRIDSKALAKVKAGTNQIMAATVKNSVVEIKFHEPYTCTYGWGVLLAGEAKKYPGALFCCTYTDGDEAHYHHGK
eukprot:GFYU01005357.1.p1 GENE.GFYU01005357.1~~GFYU01005357.1.p1  ORF type:complete len:290 (+),score=90.85 GFYU01005357.1:24-893(+)